MTGVRGVYMGEVPLFQFSVAPGDSRMRQYTLQLYIRIRAEIFPYTYGELRTSEGSWRYRSERQVFWLSFLGFRPCLTKAPYRWLALCRCPIETEFCYKHAIWPPWIHVYCKKCMPLDRSISHTRISWHLTFRLLYYDFTDDNYFTLSWTGDTGLSMTSIR